MRKGPAVTDEPAGSSAPGPDTGATTRLPRPAADDFQPDVPHGVPGGATAVPDPETAAVSTVSAPVSGRPPADYGGDPTREPIAFDAPREPPIEAATSDEDVHLIPGAVIGGVQVARSHPLLTDPAVGAGEIGGERLDSRAADDRLNLMRQRRKLVLAVGVDVAGIDGGLAGQPDNGTERIRDLRCRNGNDDHLGGGCVAAVPPERDHVVAAAAPQSGQTAPHMTSTDHNDLHRVDLSQPHLKLVTYQQNTHEPPSGQQHA